MNTKRSLYKRHRYPPSIISYAVFLYHRYSLSFREVEQLLAERGVTVSYEAIRQWCIKFSANYCRKLRKSAGNPGDIWHLDEVFIKIRGKQHYLWRAVDQDHDEIDILVQKRRNKKAALRFFRRLFSRSGTTPNKVVTDKLPSYRAALNEVEYRLPHCTDQYQNNRAELSHQLNSTTRTKDATFQINQSVSTLSVSSWLGRQSIQA